MTSFPASSSKKIYSICDENTDGKSSFFRRKSGSLTANMIEIVSSGIRSSQKLFRQTPMECDGISDWNIPSETCRTVFSVQTGEQGRNGILNLIKNQKKNFQHAFCLPLFLGYLSYSLCLLGYALIEELCLLSWIKMFSWFLQNWKIKRITGGDSGGEAVAVTLEKLKTWKTSINLTISSLNNILTKKNHSPFTFPITKTSKLHFLSLPSLSLRNSFSL